jgi:hypothetical protein
LRESVDNFIAWLEYHVAAAPPAFIFPQPFRFQGIALASSLVCETRSGATLVWIEGDYLLNHEPSTSSPPRRSPVAQFEIVRTGDRIKVSASCLERLLSIWFLALLGEIAKDYPEATDGLTEYVRTRSGRIPGAEGKHLLADLLKLGETDLAAAVLNYVGAKPFVDPGDGSQSARQSDTLGEASGLTTDAAWATPQARPSLQHQLADLRNSLCLIEERKSQYVQETDIPLQLIKDERRICQQIADFEERLDRMK